MSNQDTDPYLYFSSIAYDAPETRQQTMDTTDEINQFTVDPQFNEAEHFAAYNADTGQVIISHRGTNNLNDVGTDLALAAGSLQTTDRYQRAFDFTRRVSQAYSGWDIHHTGHSLGGTLGDDLARRFNHSSTVFNRGSSPFEQTKPVSEQHRHIRTSEDLISSFAPASEIRHTATHPVAQLLEQARFHAGHLRFLAPNWTASRAYSAYTGHLLQSFFT